MMASDSSRHEFPAGLVDRIDFLLQPPGAGGIPHHGNNLHDRTGRIDHR